VLSRFRAVKCCDFSWMFFWCAFAFFALTLVAILSETWRGFTIVSTYINTAWLEKIIPNNVLSLSLKYYFFEQKIHAAAANISFVLPSFQNTCGGIQTILTPGVHVYIFIRARNALWKPSMITLLLHKFKDNIRVSTPRKNINSQKCKTVLLRLVMYRFMRVNPWKTQFLIYGFVYFVIICVLFAYAFVPGVP